jgi:hypothetical protein
MEVRLASNRCAVPATATPLRSGRRGASCVADAYKCQASSNSFLPLARHAVSSVVLRTVLIFLVNGECLLSLDIFSAEGVAACVPAQRLRVGCIVSCDSIIGFPCVIGKNGSFSLFSAIENDFRKRCFLLAFSDISIRRQCLAQARVVSSIEARRSICVARVASAAFLVTAWAMSVMAVSAAVWQS